jgi:hypothetical protein
MFHKKFENFSSSIDHTGAFFVKTAKIYENFQIMKNFQFSSELQKYNFLYKFNSILIIGKVSIKIILLGH